MPTAADAFGTAVQNARIDELLKKAPQLGVIAEILIGLIGTMTGNLLSGAIGRAITSVNAARVWNGSVKPADFEGAVAAQSGFVNALVAQLVDTSKGKVKEKFTGNTPQSQIKNAFLQKLQTRSVR